MEDAVEHDPEAVAALTAVWQARGLDASSLRARTDGTLMAVDRGLTVDASVLALRERVASGEHATVDSLQLGEELGRGGMGIVRAAEQPSVRREVAVKLPHEARSEHAMRGLLKEAWVGANLEHPNIIPVHTVTEVDSAPAVVMKRIEGDVLTTLLRDPTRLPERHREDPLAFHLEVVVAVTNALALAHSRGIVHLDLKPDNVMIGKFGEVYVLDWGLAAGFGERAPEWLSHVRDIQNVAGTPDYMAPELAMGAGDTIDLRTDVFLVGGLLHTVVTGKAPYAGGNTFSKLLAAFQAAPVVYGSDVPKELASILHRAMAKDPADRFATVEALRAAIEAFSRHRGAEALIREARERLTELERHIATRSEQVVLSRAFGGCRYALNEARIAHADHPELAGLSRRLYQEMAGWALDTDRLELAGSYLAELSDPDATFVERLAKKRSEADAREAAIVQLEDSASRQELGNDGGARAFVSLLFACSLLAVNLTQGFLVRAGRFEPDYPGTIVGALGCLVVLGALTVRFRQAVLRSSASASVFWVSGAGFIVVTGYWTSCMLLAVPFQDALALVPIFYLLGYATLTVLITLRFVIAPLLQVPSLLLAARFPEYAFDIVAVFGAAGALVIGYRWRDGGWRTDAGSAGARA